MAMFIPSSLSVTAGPPTGWSTVTDETIAEATVTVVTAVTAVPLAGVTVKI